MTTVVARADLLSPEFKADPFPFYAQLRAHAPVYSVPNFHRGQQAWLVTRYDDVATLLKSEDFAKNPKNALTPEQLRKAPGLPPIFKSLTNNLLSLDAPDHTRLRTLAHQAFTPRRVEQMRIQMHTLAHQLLDQLQAKRRTERGTVDLIAEYALPLPITIVGRILGVPERDNDMFHRWTQNFIAIGTGRNVLTKMPGVVRFIRYLRKLIRQRAKEPQDDLISALVLAQEHDDRLSEDEILAMTFLLLSAGHETTVNLLASGTLALLEHPEQWRKWQADPSLAKTAVEELLRFVSPVEMATERFARTEVDIAGTVIPKGALVFGVIASANRDAEKFDQPDMLDITRQNNKHLAFGQGIHYCVGAPLSRLEGQVALTALTERLPELRLAVPPAQLRWRSSLVVRGLESLPVSS